MKSGSFNRKRSPVCAGRLLAVDALLGLLAWCAAAGCAPKLSGSWETVDVQPAGASFPFNTVQFDPSGKYTASGLYDGSGRMTNEVRTTTGDFRQSGSQLQIQPHKGELQSYQLRRRLDGKLEVILQRPGEQGQLKAIFAPSG
jgi:beta-glucanase (GH16 family)